MLDATATATAFPSSFTSERSENEFAPEAGGRARESPEKNNPIAYNYKMKTRACPSVRKTKSMSFPPFLVL